MRILSRTKNALATPTADKLLRGSQLRNYTVREVAKGPHKLYAIDVRHKIGEENRQIGQTQKRGRIGRITIEKPAAKCQPGSGQSAENSGFCDAQQLVYRRTTHQENYHRRRADVRRLQSSFSLYIIIYVLYFFGT